MGVTGTILDGDGASQAYAGCFAGAVGLRQQWRAALAAWAVENEIEDARVVDWMEILLMPELLRENAN